ncbi:hypothetical protein IEN85_07565 [Pelagicoccus sp. NFK12]|uniref:Tetratricopeptide repeat protein n=1 Tax=Pelagicoccus enzymogenes TaxID=2773457 RepID=A0A927F6J3_9BACT|nr:hypothetical protein [Pelagicoccus enzymogenes]MBD5779348.1 hypothetical protein [Pelagicoccus enzymogenes]
MNFKKRLAVLWFLSSLGAGLLLQPVRQRAVDEADAGNSLASLSQGLGHGITLAALGGYRNVAANFVWISMYGDWRYRLKEEVLEKMQLAVSLNPESVYFWVDGSRIIANDMPVWQVGDDFMESLFESEEGIEIRKAYGEQALAFLERAPEAMSHEIPILVEKAAICWQRLADLDRALVFFKQAVQQEEVPNHICRVYAEILVKNGQVREAYEYLKSHYATLSDDDRTALKPFVARRIEALGAQLGEGS